MFEPINVRIDGGYEIDFPKMIPVLQKFNATRVEDIEGTVTVELSKPKIASKIKPKQKIAIAVGSRGVANTNKVVKAIVAKVKDLGAEPFVIPAMGSHGGATADGQTQVLASYGVTEDYVGAPIVASMDVVQVGNLSNGLPVYCDSHAYHADGIIVLNRVKAHTDFKGPYESGLVKMMVIGLGKHKGATVIHSNGFANFKDVIPEAGKILLEKTPVLFGVALLENSYDQTAMIEAIPNEDIMEREPVLLEESKGYLPRFTFPKIDVLLVDQIGKDISGAGMDPNIVGRPGSGLSGFDGVPEIQKIVALGLTETTHGNAVGIGTADLTTRKVVNEIDFSSTYANSITSTVLGPSKIPMTMNTEKEALVVALKTLTNTKISDAKIVYIKNTLELQQIYVSEALLPEVQDVNRFEILGEAEEIKFNAEDEIIVRPKGNEH